MQTIRSIANAPIKLSTLSLLVLLLTASLMISRTPTQASSASFAMGFSTFLGGSGWDQIRDVVTDAQGNIYVTGDTDSNNFPTTPGAYDRSHNGGYDGFVAKFSPSGSLIWSTYLGGSGTDFPLAMELDPQGNLVIAGQAGPGFPTTAGVVQRHFGGDVDPSNGYGAQDGFVTKMSPSGSIIWSTYFGGDDGSFFRDIALDGTGNVYGAMSDVERNSPHITPGAFQTTRPSQGRSSWSGHDSLVVKLNPSASRVIWASYLGGPEGDGWNPSIRVDGAGYPVVLTHTQSPNMPTTANAYDRYGPGNGDDPNDLFVAKFQKDGSGLVFGTYLGGSGIEFLETHELGIDPNNNIIVAALTRSTDFPTTGGVLQRNYGGTGGGGTGMGTNYPGDGFVTRLSANGSQILASTYLGGEYGDGVEGITVDPAGRIYVSGSTHSPNFPRTNNAYQNNKGGGADFFVARLSPDLRTLEYATFVGGSTTDYGRSIHVDGNGTIYVGGNTRSSNWPRRNAAQSNLGGGTDGALVKLVAQGGSPPPAPTSTPRPTQTPPPLVGECGPDSCLYIPLVYGPPKR